jgi:RNA recognition motif-containing protein
VRTETQSHMGLDDSFSSHQSNGTLFVSNLEMQLTQSEITNFFSTYGPLSTPIQLMKSQNCNHRNPTNFCLVTFKRKKDAQFALLNAQHHIFLSKPINVQPYMKNLSKKNNEILDTNSVRTETQSHMGLDDSFSSQYSKITVKMNKETNVNKVINDNKTLIIEGLKASVRVDDLAKTFKKFGEITLINIKAQNATIQFLNKRSASSAFMNARGNPEICNLFNGAVYIFLATNLKQRSPVPQFQKPPNFQNPFSPNVVFVPPRNVLEAPLQTWYGKPIAMFIPPPGFPLKEKKHISIPEKKQMKEMEFTMDEILDILEI